MTLIGMMIEEQYRRCAYGTRYGDGRPCDCKFELPDRPRTSEMTGCAELRMAISRLKSDDAVPYFR